MRPCFGDSSDAYYQFFFMLQTQEILYGLLSLSCDKTWTLKRDVFGWSMCSLLPTWSFLLRPPSCLFSGWFLCGGVFLLHGAASATSTTGRDQQGGRRFSTWHRRLVRWWHLSIDYFHYFHLLHTHSEFGILVEEVWCSRGRSSLCLHRQIRPSRRCPSPPHLDLLKCKNGKEDMTQGNDECCRVESDLLGTPVLPWWT